MEHNPIKERLHICDYGVCRAAFKHSIRLMYHKRTHTRESPYKCYHGDCTAAFKHSSQLINHKRTHTKERLYKCYHGDCTAAFKLSSKLIHHKQTHTQAKTYKCDYGDCTAAYKLSSKLKRHKRTHTLAKTYKCDYCTAAFIFSSYLITHSRTHTKERPYKCNHRDCTAAFKRSSNLIAHQQTHTKARPYKCDYGDCTAAFISSSYLITHKRTHIKERSYKCDHRDCTAAFISSSYLITHKRTHIKERSYKCGHGDCLATFKQLCNLINHKRTHTGKSPYKCDYGDCTAAFKQSSYLKGHKRIHARNPPHHCAEGSSASFGTSCELTQQPRAHSGQGHLKGGAKAHTATMVPPQSLTEPRMRTVDLHSKKMKIEQDEPARRSPNNGSAIPAQLKRSSRLLMREQLALRSIASEVSVDKLRSASTGCARPNYQIFGLQTHESQPSADSDRPESQQMPVVCSVESCLCVRGRDFTEEGTMWQILVCRTCGSRGAHRRCADVLLMCSEWQCTACLRVRNFNGEDDRSADEIRETRNADVGKSNAPPYSTVLSIKPGELQINETDMSQKAASTPIKHELNIGEVLIEDIIKKEEEEDTSWDIYLPPISNELNIGAVLIGDIKKE